MERVVVVRIDYADGSVGSAHVIAVMIRRAS
jgi:hypothetical protein